MRFSLFYELQLPRPWDENSEQRLFDEALEQIRLADQLGFHCAWGVEHHFLEEYAHSSASAVWLAAAAAQTRRIRIGLGILPLPVGYQHPARVAEAAATLDLISHGRVELGTGETSSATELGGFGVDRATKRAQWRESLDVVVRMLTEEPFAGHRGQYLDIPQRNVIPKPRQKPHPPLWVACSQRETIRLAAENGLGALSFSFATPAEANAWSAEYYELIGSDNCVPSGLLANPNFALALPMHVHRDEETARQRGAEGAQFFGYALAHYYAFGDHRPGVSEIYAEFKREGGRLASNGSADATSAIGTPQQIADLARAYEDAGVDELLLAVQVGATKHEHILQSLELFAAEVMPEFEERRPRVEEVKARRLVADLGRAHDRRRPATVSDPRYVVGQDDPPAGRTARRDSRVASDLRSIKRSLKIQAEAALKALVRRSPDTRLEQFAGSALGLKAIFKAMEGRYVPGSAAGFKGEIQYELKYDDGRIATWSLTIDSQQAKATDAPAGEPALTISAPLADFIRIATGEMAPAKALLTGRIDIKGDLVVAARLGEMFGQPSPF